MNNDYIPIIPKFKDCKLEEEHTSSNKEEIAKALHSLKKLNNIADQLIKNKRESK
jgi:hypothetical protein